MSEPLGLHRPSCMIDRTCPCLFGRTCMALSTYQCLHGLVGAMGNQVEGEINEITACLNLQHNGMGYMGVAWCVWRWHEACGGAALETMTRHPNGGTAQLHME